MTTPPTTVTHPTIQSVWLVNVITKVRDGLSDPGLHPCFYGVVLGIHSRLGDCLPGHASVFLPHPADAPPYRPGAD